MQPQVFILPVVDIKLRGQRSSKKWRYIFLFSTADLDVLMQMTNHIPDREDETKDIYGFLT